jgi:hypothetical protein
VTSGDGEGIITDTKKSPWLGPPVAKASPIFSPRDIQGIRNRIKASPTPRLPGAALGGLPSKGSAGNPKVSPSPLKPLKAPERRRDVTAPTPPVIPKSISHFLI